MSSLKYDKIDNLINIEIEEAFGKAHSDPFPDFSEAFTNLYAE